MPSPVRPDAHGRVPELDGARFRAAFEHSVHLMLLVDASGAVLDCNETGLAFFGSWQAVAGRAVWELPWPGLDARATDELREAVAAAGSGSPSRMSIGIAQADGPTLTLDASFTPVRDGTGRVAMVLGEAADVTERARVEAELRASEAKFAGILEIAVDAIISVDEQYNIVHYNRGAELIFGFSAQEAIGQQLAMLLPPRFRSVHRGHIAAFAAAAHSARQMGERGEIYGLRKSGAEFPAEASISKLNTPVGQLFTVVLRDITARKRAEENDRFLAEAGAALSRSLDVEATVQAAADLAIPRLGDACIVTLAGREARPPRHVASAHADPDVSSLLRALESHAGPLWHDLDGVSPGAASTEVADAPHAALVVSDAWLATHVPDVAARALLRALRVRSLVVVPLVARGQTLGEMSVLALEPGRGVHGHDDADIVLAGALALRAALAIDNARLYQTAQRATQARNEVLGVVSHDLRNPVSAIAMCAKVLRDTPPDDAAERRELLTAISDATALVHRMIQDLLDVSSIDAARLSLERAAEPLAPLVDGAITMVSGAAHDRGVAVRAELPAGLPLVDVDAARVLQVLGNLLGNAVKFTGTGGRVAIRAELLGHEVVVSVADTGPGIPAGDLPHVFDRYWHARRNARTRGTGLGLAIAKGIIEAHGGRIWAESREGCGATFYFTLPTAEASTEAA
jgi:PAS domain S-box-containing protein